MEGGDRSVVLDLELRQLRTRSSCKQTLLVRDHTIVVGVDHLMGRINVLKDFVRALSFTTPSLILRRPPHHGRT